MAVHLNCSSSCLPDGATVAWSLLPNHTAPAVAVTPNVADGYIASVDNGLTILSVNASKHAGTFQCSYNDRILTKHRISLSGMTRRPTEHRCDLRTSHTVVRHVTTRPLPSAYPAVYGELWKFCCPCSSAGASLNEDPKGKNFPNFLMTIFHCHSPASLSL